jgi:bifunctional DNase/RNase
MLSEVTEVKVGALIMDPNSSTPIIVLKGVDSDVILPIWVGNYEANAIALEIEKIAPQRPMTHDLIKNIINELGLEMKKVVINNLRENTFFAQIYLSKENGQMILLDARPSDAIALALRFDSSIYISNHILELTMAGDTTSGPAKAESHDTQTVSEDWPDIIQ